eukprot:7832751-Pyramimonas_sp.AAC.1
MGASKVALALANLSIRGSLATTCAMMLSNDAFMLDSRRAGIGSAVGLMAAGSSGRFPTHLVRYHAHTMC